MKGRFIQVISADVVNKKGIFFEDINFDICFRCSKPISYIFFDVIWHSMRKSGKKQDIQLIVDAEVGPIQAGINRIVLPAPAPKITRIADPEEFCNSGLLLRAKYRDDYFFSKPFRMVNEIPTEFSLERPDLSRITRTISPCD